MKQSSIKHEFELHVLHTAMSNLSNNVLDISSTTMLYSKKFVHVCSCIIFHNILNGSLDEAIFHLCRNYLNMFNNYARMLKIPNHHNKTMSII